jgi:hypothetical protein
LYGIIGLVSNYKESKMVELLKVAEIWLSIFPVETPLEEDYNPDG